MKQRIYLDHAATTPIIPQAREAMAKARTKLSKSVGLTVKNRKKANENKS